jgi:hypothetical protein
VALGIMFLAGLDVGRFLFNDHCRDRDPQTLSMGHQSFVVDNPPTSFTSIFCSMSLAALGIWRNHKLRLHLRSPPCAENLGWKDRQQGLMEKKQPE